MRPEDRFGNTDWHPPMPAPGPAPATAYATSRRRRRLEDGRPSGTGGWLLALGAGAAIALVTVASLSDPRSLGTQLDEAVAAVRGLGDRATQGLAESGQAAAETSHGAVENLSTAINDAAISAKIKAALAADPALSASRIVVTTDNGVVRLEGPAPSDAARQRATVLASARDGVRAVDNRLVLPQPGQVVAVVGGQPQLPPASAAATQLPAVAPPPAQAPASSAAAVDDDATITGRVKSALATDAVLAQAGIGVKTERGVVVMEGRVPDLHAKDHALALASTQPGVRQVDNRLAVDAPAQAVVASRSPAEALAP